MLKWYNVITCLKSILEYVSNELYISGGSIMITVLILKGSPSSSSSKLAEEESRILERWLRQKVSSATTYLVLSYNSTDTTDAVPSRGRKPSFFQKVRISLLFA